MEARRHPGNAGLVPLTCAAAPPPRSFTQEFPGDVNCNCEQGGGRLWGSRRHQPPQLPHSSATLPCLYPPPPDPRIRVGMQQLGGVDYPAPDGRAPMFTVPTAPIITSQACTAGAGRRGGRQAVGARECPPVLLHPNAAAPLWLPRHRCCGCWATISMALPKMTT